MKLVVGLGNPGKKHEGTRHNVGFMVVDALRREVRSCPAPHGMQGYPEPDVVRGWGLEVGKEIRGWKLEKKLQSAICYAPYAVLAKPQVFMNESGRAIKKILRYYDMPASRDSFGIKILRNLWIVHDDVDLPLGRIKIQIGGSSAGHKGVQSIIDCLGREDFVRFRMGIGRPREKLASQRLVRLWRKIGNWKLDKKLEVRGEIIESFVLSKFKKEEKSVVEKMVKRAVKAIRLGLEEGIERAIGKFN